MTGHRGHSDHSSHVQCASHSGLSTDMHTFSHLRMHSYIYTYLFTLTLTLTRACIPTVPAVLTCAHTHIDHTFTPTHMACMGQRETPQGWPQCAGQTAWVPIRSSVTTPGTSPPPPFSLTAIKSHRLVPQPHFTAQATEAKRLYASQESPHVLSPTPLRCEPASSPCH